MQEDGICLRDVRVRPVRADETERFDRLLRERHCLGWRKSCGSRLRHVAVQGEAGRVPCLASRVLGPRRILSLRV